MRTRFHAIAVGAVVLVALTACGGSVQVASKGAVKIGVDLPEALPEGAATLNGVRFAVQRAGGSVGGWTLVIDHRDDTRQGSPSADAGVENVQAMLGNGDVGMIGPYTSSVAKAEIPIAAAQHFAMISPSTTQPCLTRDESFCSYRPQHLRGANPNNFFRLVTTNLEQARAMADYFYKRLTITNVAILDDSTVFGVVFAGAFETEFKKLGGTVAKHSEYKKDQQGSDFRSILNSFKNAGAKAVYVGGTDDQNICIPRKQMKDIGWDVPFTGGDGIETTDCIDQATGNEAGIYATSAGADATQVPGAAQTIADFRKAFPGPNDFGGYTMQGYDATNALMAAIGRAINAANGGTPTRDQVRAEMAKTKGFVGVIGTYDFDPNGDTSLKIVSIYIVNGKLSADQVKSSTGVCGSKTAKDACFVWKTQFDFAKTS